MIEAKLWIGGAGVAARSGATFERKNPVSGKAASRAAAAGPEDAVAAVESAAAAFPAWAALGPTARRKHLQAAAARLQERAGEFAQRVSAETGATAGWGHFNVMFAASLFEEAAALTTQVGGEVIPSDHGAFSMGVRKPAGVVLGIAPWNAPVILGVRAIATPLACGNTVVLKASEVCPATHALIGEVCQEAGLPAGVVNVITHDAAAAAAVVEAAVAHAAVRRVNFTGSTRVGRIVAELCGRHLKPVLLELGGKAPLVVLDDADLDAAVNAAAFGAFMHQGQICMSTERIVVDEKVGESFVAKLRAKTETLAVGDPAQGQFPLGGVVDMSTVERVNALLDDAVAKGARIVAGGKANSTLMPPTVVDGVKPGMRLYSEESFGPVVAVVRTRGVEEAVRSANDTEYGLAAAVFGGDVGRALAVAQRIDSGICHVNGPTVQDEGQMPFGGVKSSGYGRFGGKAGIDEFTDVRWITVQQSPRHYPF
jgi:acyl-CoA reductase-like NAD-dependent aldehyde dehydrogenase